MAGFRTGVQNGFKSSILMCSMVRSTWKLEFEFVTLYIKATLINEPPNYPANVD